ncbi:MAG: hypothetical protein AABX88_00940 [Nanoarchaeota archaeon]
MELKEARKLMNRIIKKSFLLLNDRKIFLFEFNFKKYEGGTIRLPFFDIIIISKKIKHDKKRVIALFAHELSHLERFKKKGWKKYILEESLYWFNDKIRIDEDNGADKLAIERGYGKELYYSRIKSNKNKKRKSITKYYLTPKEIKSYAKKIKNANNIRN